IRLAYAADLPSPDEVISRLTQQGGAPSAAPSTPGLPPRGPSGGGGGGGASAMRVEAVQSSAAPSIVATPTTMQMPSAQPQPVVQPALATVTSYRDLIALAQAKRDVLVKLALESQMRPVSFEQGR